jgi:hypothetical protein
MGTMITGVAAAQTTRGVPTSSQPGDLAFPLFSLLTALLCIGCANPGPPKPPSLHLPALVTDLSAERTGNRVVLRWSTPSTTTDDLPVKGAMTAQICREVGPRPGAPVARLAACAPILRLAVAPGASEVADTLPRSLCSDPVVLLTYRIQIMNSVERSAGDSTIAAFAAGGTAPPPVEAFNVTPSERGAVLEWTAPARPAEAADQVELTRTDLSAPAAAKPAKAAKPHSGRRAKPATPEKSSTLPPGQVHLRTPETAAPGTDGTVDITAKFGETYTYTAERLRPVAVGSHGLEIRSEPSSPVTVALRDTFPPRSPAGLATVPSSGNSAPYIDLSWEPNTEPDLAGYFVYRQLIRLNGDLQGPLARLTQSPVTAPAYRDVAVHPGQRYSYWVTAVDASGNESAPSAKAQEVVTPERNEPLNSPN